MNTFVIGLLVTGVLSVADADSVRVAPLDGLRLGGAPPPVRPLDPPDPGSGLLRIPEGKVRTEVKIGFDDRTVSVRRVLSADPSLGIDTMILWEAYYPELADYLDEVIMKSSYDLRRSFASRGGSREEVGQAGRFELPVRLPEWAARFGAARPSLQLTGSYTLSLRATSNWRSTDPNPDRFPDISPEQIPNIHLTGNIGRLISVRLNWTQEGFGVDPSNLLQIRYAGQTPEETEDDIVQELEFGQVRLALPGTQLTGYTEQASGLIGLKGRFRFGEVDWTVVAGGERGERQRQSLGGAVQTRTVRRADNAILLHAAYFLSRSQRALWERAGGSTAGMRLVSGLQVFRQVTTSEINARPEWGRVFTGTARPLGDDGRFVESDALRGVRWVRIPEEDWGHDRGLLLFRGGRADNEAIAVAWTESPQTTFGAVGDTLDLVLIKAPNDPVILRPLMLRNRYPLEAVAPADRAHVEIRVFDRSSNRSDPSLDEQGIPWVQRLGLTDAEGRLRIDDRSIFDWDRNHLVLPGLRPFDPDSQNLLGRSVIYDTTASALRQVAPRFEIVITSRSRSSIIQVAASGAVGSGGCMDILPGSEAVILNGSITLTRGVDYDVDYPTGTITLLSPRALDPAARVSVDYECTPFFSLETRTVAGTRVETRLPFGGEGSVAGATLLYRTETVTDPRPQLGNEPNTSWLWGGNVRLQGKAGWLTELADRVPFVTPRGGSTWRVELEGAQSWNDPNTDRVAVVDDFETSRRDFVMPILRTSWNPASPPGGVPQDGEDYNALLDHRTQGEFVWHSNTQVALADIYPDHDDGDGQRAHQPVLQFRLRPNDFGAGLSWGGVMRPVPDGNRDQTRASFLELVVRASGGELHVDLGSISEDVSVNGDAPNRRVDGEDLDTLGLPTGFVKNDFGLDGIIDTAEVRLRWACYLGGVCTPSAVDGRGVVQDPAADNYLDDFRSNDPAASINGTQGNNSTRDHGARTWFDTEDIDRNGRLDVFNDFHRYTVVLGGTRATPADRLRGGWRILRIPLDGPSRVIGAGADFANLRAVRVWYGGLSQVNGANQLEDRVQIARISLVGNEWVESGRLVRNDSVAVVDSTWTNRWGSFDTFVIPSGSSLRVGSVGRRENPGGYRSFDVPSIRVPGSGALMEERSLELIYTGLRPFGRPDSGTAMRTFRESRDFTAYRELVLQVHHALNVPSEGLDPPRAVRLGLQLGSGDVKGGRGNYYEYSFEPAPAACGPGDTHPDCAELSQEDRLSAQRESWRRNRISFPLALLSHLRDSLRGVLGAGEVAHMEALGASFPAGEGPGTRRDSLAVRGNPSLSNIQWIRLWVAPVAENLRASDTAISGTMWINDLRLEEPWRGPGSALRASAQLQVADLTEVSGALGWTEGGFVPLGSRRPALSQTATTATATGSGRLQLDKFLPEAWGVRLPLSASVSANISRPWARGDFVLQRHGLGEIVGQVLDGNLSRRDGDFAARDPRAFQTLVTERRLSSGWSKSAGTGSGPGATLSNIFLERPTLAWTWAAREEEMPSRRDSTRTHAVDLRYDFTPPGSPSWRPLGSLRSVWLPSVVEELEIRPFPSRVQAELARLDWSESRRNSFGEDADTLIRREERVLAGLGHRLDVEWAPLQFARASWDIDLTRTFDRQDEARRLDPGTLFREASPLVFGLDTTDVDGQRQGFWILRSERGRTQSFDVVIDPRILPFLTTSGTFTSNSNFQREGPRALVRNGDTLSVTRYFRLDARDGFTARLGLDLTALLRSMGRVVPGEGSMGRGIGRVQRALESWRVRPLSIDYATSTDIAGLRASLPHFHEEGLDGAGLWRMQLGLGDESTWRDPLDIMAGRRSKEGLGGFRPSRLENPTELNRSLEASGGPDYDFGALAARRSYSLSGSSEFTVPGPQLALGPSATWSRSWREAWATPHNVDSTITWPSLALRANLGNFAPRVAALRGFFSTMTASHQTSWEIVRNVSPHSSSADRRQERTSFQPLLGINARTRGNWTFDTRLNWSFSRSTSWSKTSLSAEEIPDDAPLAMRSPVFWLRRSAAEVHEQHEVRQELSAGYRLQTRRGVQILRWFVRLDNDLNINSRAGWSVKTTDRTIADSVDASSRPVAGRTERTEDMGTMYFESGADYAFTPRLNANFSSAYRRTSRRVKEQDQPAVDNTIDVQGRLIYRF